jgi:hypothetical protein
MHDAHLVIRRCWGDNQKFMKGMLKVDGTRRQPEILKVLGCRVTS